MDFTYYTDRLKLQILPPTEAYRVLEFYQKNRGVFESAEPPFSPNFYELDHQRAILTAEYNMAIHTTLLRFWLSLKERPEELIGTVSFRSIERAYRQSCLLGYKLGKDYQGYGYATEAVREGVRIAFDVLELHRISCEVMPENTRSIRLMERLGFVKEGVERKSIFINGEWHDHILFSLLSSKEYSLSF